MPDRELLNYSRPSGCGRHLVLLVVGGAALVLLLACVVNLPSCATRGTQRAAAPTPPGKQPPEPPLTPDPDPDPGPETPPAPEPEVAPAPRRLPAPQPPPPATPPSRPDPTPVPPTPRPLPPPPPEPKPPAAAKPEPKPTPERASGQGVTVTVYSLKDAAALRKDLKPGPGQHLVVADVEVLNTGRAGLRYTPQAFKVKDKTGREAAATLKQFEGALLKGELTKGQRVRGRVAFLVPATAGLALVFHPAGLKDPITVKMTR